MRKFDLVHTAVIIIGLVMGYAAVSKFLGVLLDISYSSPLPGARGGDLAFYDLIIAILFAVACIILIKRGRYYTTLILKEEPEESDNEALSVMDLDRTNLIFVFLVALGIYIISYYLPFLLVNLFELFQDKIGKANFGGQLPGKDRIAVDALAITIGAFLIYAAPALSRKITRKA